MVEGTRKEVMSMKDRQKKRLLNEFKYLYDEVIFMGITRYEFGLWLMFAIGFFLRKALLKCGDKKTVFDFMRPSAALAKS